MSDTAFRTTVAQILDGSTKPIDEPDEAAFLEEWTKSAAPLSTPLSQAIAGGAIADRLAWVFVAGYQAALRRVFPELPIDGFAAYVASEDRKGELPGVAVLEHKDGFSLAGNKTWVASSNHVQHLIVSTGEREDTCFYLIHRDADGRPEIHDDIIDVVFVTSGAGTLLVGGEMLNRTGSLGTGIAGGARHPVSAGDMLHIPARTPHGYLVPDGGHITYVLVRVPAFSG